MAKAWEKDIFLLKTTCVLNMSQFLISPAQLLFQALWLAVWRHVACYTGLWLLGDMPGDLQVAAIGSSCVT